VISEGQPWKETVKSQLSTFLGVELKKKGHKLDGIVPFIDFFNLFLKLSVSEATGHNLLGDMYVCMYVYGGRGVSNPGLNPTRWE
jgi:hypothetical protein